MVADFHFKLCVSVSISGSLLPSAELGPIFQPTSSRYIHLKLFCQCYENISQQFDHLRVYLDLYISTPSCIPSLTVSPGSCPWSLVCPGLNLPYLPGASILKNIGQPGKPGGQSAHHPLHPPPPFLPPVRLCGSRARPDYLTQRIRLDYLGSEQQTKHEPRSTKLVLCQVSTRVFTSVGPVAPARPSYRNPRQISQPATKWTAKPTKSILRACDSRLRPVISRNSLQYLRNILLWVLRFICASRNVDLYIFPACSALQRCLSTAFLVASFRFFEPSPPWRASSPPTSTTYITR
ncbi:hypothetical protein F5Y08DRAFT_156030 [Xylaria arbuscula]|nr:hypothetical protein F5Y08DRAFT_156030 [Xylaria arbuscula]